MGATRQQDRDYAALMPAALPVFSVSSFSFSLMKSVETQSTSPVLICIPTRTWMPYKEAQRRYLIGSVSMRQPPVKARRWSLNPSVSIIIGLVFSCFNWFWLSIRSYDRRWPPNPPAKWQVVKDGPCTSPLCLQTALNNSGKTVFKQSHEWGLVPQWTSFWNRLVVLRGTKGVPAWTMVFTLTAIDWRGLCNDQPTQSILSRFATVLADHWTFATQAPGLLMCTQCQSCDLLGTYASGILVL